MTSHATADPGLHDRRLFIAKSLAANLLDGLEDLEVDVARDRGIQRRVDDLVHLAAVLTDELDEMYEAAIS